MADVTIYTRQFCGYCASAKALLDQKGVAYVEHDATGKPDLREEMIAKSKRMALRSQLTQGGDRIVVVAGYPFGIAGSTNTLHIAKLTGNELYA